MKTAKEKELEIALLTEKIERISGKKVKFLTEEKKPVQKLIINDNDWCEVTADYKGTEELIDEFTKAIKKLFNGNVYEIPSFNGSDMFGFLVTKRKFSKKEINQVDRDNCPSEEE